MEVLCHGVLGFEAMMVLESSTAAPPLTLLGSTVSTRSSHNSQGVLVSYPNS